MKKLISFFLCLALLLGCAGAVAEGPYTPGVYEASVQGMGGPVAVTMEFSEDAIVSVSATGDMETKGLGDVAIAQLAQAVMEQQTADLDVISGATISSTAMLSAATDCIRQAKGIREQNAAITDETADVIVVGAGAAGLSAAAGAVGSGASVIVLEANSFLGGATGTSMGNILDINPEAFAQAEHNDASLEKYAAYGEDRFPEPWRTDYRTLMQQIEAYTGNGAEKGKFVSTERVLIDHYVKGMGTDLDGNVVTLDYDMIRSGVENARSIYLWLEGYGLTTTPLMEYVSTPAGRGMGLVELLNKAADGAEIRLSTRARELLVEDGRITGVIAENAEGNRVTYHANRGVILATGSFSSNGEMVAKYQRIGTGLTAHIPSNNPAGNRGDGIVMAEAVGAQLRDMSFIQTYLKGYQNLAASGEASNAFKAAQLLVNTNAVRFADDSNQSRIVSREGNDQPDGVLIAVGDSKMIDALNAQKEGFADELIARGMAWKADTLEELAQLAGLDGATLTDTVNTFNSYVSAGADPDFGRKTFNGSVENGPYYAAKLQLACHLTFGGLVIDQQARVLDVNGAPIEGLYAAGDVTSGYEGIVHQTGDCLTIVINTGRIAGENAAEATQAAQQVALGAKYFKGEGVEQNFEEAFKLFRQAADQGNRDGIAWLSKCYFYGRGVEQSYEEAAKLVLTAVGRKDAVLPEDYMSTLNKFATGSAQEDCDPCTWIGRFYYNGFVLEKNYEEAFKWFHMAAMREDPASFTWVGKCYYNGYGVEQDYSKSIEWFFEGAAHDDVDAFTWIRKSYWHGSGVEQSYENAMKWYIPAAERGHAYSYTHLGRCYFLGLGVEQNFEEAFKWNMLGAEAGYTYVYWWLGEHYYNGLGVERNFEKAYEWYMRGAEAGRSECYYPVGKCYCYGTGVETDLDAARYWFELGAEKGDSCCKNMLSHLK